MQLYLLTPSSEPTPPSVEVNGLHWSLRPFDLSGDTSLAYSCVSYTWGLGREPSPFDSSFPVSDRTIPALKTFIQHRPTCQGIWIDAFCVPLTEPERSQTLESMGFIYARAEEVLVVLSPAVGPALKRMASGSAFNIDDLAALEKEEWVQRAWTYQESANAKTLFLTCEEEENAIIHATSFFNGLGNVLSHLEGSWMDNLHTYPRLHAFEDIMADYWSGGFEGRAAMNVMSNMDRRVQARAEDHFYAMIGAISAEKVDQVENVSPTEAFMRVCEKKGDFSFMYSKAKRELEQGRRWRPVAEDLPSILPWSGWGAGQPGRLCDEGLWLDEIFVEHPAPPEEKSTQYVRDWLTKLWKENHPPAETLEEEAYTTLTLMGFTGSSRWVSTAKGFFFPSEQLNTESVMKILVSTTTGWNMGRPGLLEYEMDNKKLYSPGVYIGAVENRGTTSVLVA